MKRSKILKNIDLKQLLIYGAGILLVIALFSLVLFLPKCAKTESKEPDKVTEKTEETTTKPSKKEDTTQDTTESEKEQEETEPAEDTTFDEGEDTTAKQESADTEKLPDNYVPEKDKDNYVEPPASVDKEEIDDPLKAVPAEYKNSYYLDFRGKGSSVYLKGKIAFVFIFINDENYKWEDSEIASGKYSIDKACNNLIKNSGYYKADLNIVKEYFEASVSTKVGTDNHYVWSREAANELGYSTLAQMMSEIQTKHSADGTAVLFCYNKTGRSAAFVTSSSWYQEYALIYKDLSSIDHESLHLFGAKDFYYPDSAEQIAKECFGHSVMLNGGGDVDSLNAFLVGWTEKLSDRALMFLEKTSSYTKEDMDNAKNEDAYTGYVENRKIDGIYGEYTGYLVMGIPEGKGKMVYSSGSVYDGDWVGGRYDGYGEYTSSDDYYIGYWKDGMRHGTGTRTDFYGSTYVGSWENGLEHGKGKKTYSNGDVTEGEWEKGRPTGVCTYTYADGGVYEGELLGKQRHGSGTMHYSNGEEYIGMWQYDKRNGEGIMKFANGDVFSGNWSFDAISGIGELKYANGDVYTGGCSNGKKHGKGVMQYANGDKYDGEWYNDERHLDGTLTYADGRVEKYRYMYGTLIKKY